MLDFDKETIKRLKDSSTKVEDKLYIVARHIEEKYQFLSTPNHWEDVFNPLAKEDRIFYKVWLWMCYAEYENLVPPVPEFEEVFGIEKREKLLTYLENDNNGPRVLESKDTLNGAAGGMLLNWGLEKIKTTYP